ncbi:hypothetical protein RhiirA4_486983 [Rhizophagus irregularis]|uniref:Uncharacterized protein n=1 Tax=Rhizophagus irregularis TaxID=588596 RepID=A0A2I1HS14_9GLOM|nr:hypothetical protein RhiirA4_486983 [Rhizophagus irregularis]
MFQKDVSSKDAIGQVDYAIKSLKDLLCITEQKPRNIKIGYAQDSSKLFRSNVKRVIGIIVGLLKDRVNIDSSPDSKSREG